MMLRFPASLLIALGLWANPALSQGVDGKIFDQIVCPSSQVAPKNSRNVATEALLRSVPADYPISVRIGDYALKIPISYLKWPPSAINCPPPKGVVSVTFWARDGRATAPSTKLRPNIPESYRQTEYGEKLRSEDFIITVGIEGTNDEFRNLIIRKNNLLNNYSNLVKLKSYSGDIFIVNKRIYIDHNEKYISISSCGKNIESIEFSLCYTELAIEGFNLKFSGSFLKDYTRMIPDIVEQLKYLVTKWST